MPSVDLASSSSALHTRCRSSCRFLAVVRKLTKASGTLASSGLVCNFVTIGTIPSHDLSVFSVLETNDPSQDGQFSSFHFSIFHSTVQLRPTQWITHLPFFWAASSSQLRAILDGVKPGIKVLLHKNSWKIETQALELIVHMSFNMRTCQMI